MPFLSMAGDDVTGPAVADSPFQFSNLGAKIGCFTGITIVMVKLRPGSIGTELSRR